MTAYELSDKMAKIHRAIDCIYTLANMEGVHGLDKELLKEEGLELIRAAHDTAREFEAECIRKGHDAATLTVAR